MGLDAGVGQTNPKSLVPRITIDTQGSQPKPLLPFGSSYYLELILPIKALSRRETEPVAVLPLVHDVTDSWMSCASPPNTPAESGPSSE